MVTMRRAVLDIGSNSVKFLVVEGNTRESYRILEEESLATRLAENLIDSCELRPEAMERTLVALRDLRARADAQGVTEIRAVATSAVRDSRNRKEFLREAKAVLGAPVRLLSGNEEAETIFAGVSADPLWQGRDLFAFDIGGGSTEWIQGQAGAVQKRLSLPLGCVRLRERFVPAYPVGEAAPRLRDGVREQVQAALHDFSLGSRYLVGTGGTMTCLAAMKLKLAAFDPAKVDHTELALPYLQEEFTRMTRLSLEELKNEIGLPTKRADLILPGLAVALATLEALGTAQMTVSTRGLRYGVLAMWLAERSKE